MKRISAFLLSVLFVLATAVPAFASTRVTKMEASYTIPSVGDIFHCDEKITVAEPEKYSATVLSMYYNSGSGKVEIMDGDRIPDVQNLYVQIKFSPATGYELAESGDDDAEFYINGQKITVFSDDLVPEYEFTPKGTSPTNIFQYMISFIKRVILLIRLYFSILRPDIIL